MVTSIEGSDCGGPSSSIDSIVAGANTVNAWVKIESEGTVSLTNSDSLVCKVGDLDGCYRNVRAAFAIGADAD